MKTNARVFSAAFFFAACAVGFGGEVTFTKPPTAVKAGAGAKITFAVSKKTDVEVAVLDAKGKVVRHLAAGVLGGKNPPPAPLKAGLSQTIAWDGKDDFGQPAQGGPFKVRVRAGTGVQLDGFVGENRHHFSGFWGMATDAKGNVYILGPSTGNRSPDGTHYLQVFNRQGKYVRTLMPMPADLSPEKVRPFKAVPSQDGHFTPRNQRGTWPVLYPGLGGAAMAPRISGDGLIWFTNGKVLARIRTDGGGSGKKFTQGIWSKKFHVSQGVSRWSMSWGSRLALSPDGAAVYLSGVFQKQKKAPGKHPLVFPPGRIYRAKTADSLMDVFAEVKGADGKPAHLGGLTCDRENNLLVCDPSGGRILVFNAAGKQVGEVPVSAPRSVRIHRHTGALYVLSIKKAGPYRAVKNLIKFSGWKKGAKELARLALRKAGENAVMALDDSADPPVVWVGIDRAKTGNAWELSKRAEVLRLEDRGAQFVSTDHECRFAKQPMGVVTRLAVHPETDIIVCRGEYAHAAAYDGRSGKRLKAPFRYAVDMAVGRDGNFYVQTRYGWEGPLCKFDSHLKPVPVPGKRKPPNAVLPRVFGRYGNGFGVAGFTADAKGRLYVAEQLDQHTSSGNCVVVFSPEGKAEEHGRLEGNTRFKKHGLWKSALVGPIASVVGNIQVDRDGYLYLALRGVPFSHRPPPGFEKDAAYGWVEGSVMKIKPEGGSVFSLGGPLARPPRKEHKVPNGMPGIKLIKRTGYPRGPLFVENAVQAYPGIGSMSGGLGVGCCCRQPMFQLDDWGRLFIPNAITCSVRVVDNAGNTILRFGHYGNADSRGSGKESPIKTPAIPLGWPEAVGVSQQAIYVADVLNRRIVRLKKTFAAEVFFEVK